MKNTEQDFTEFLNGYSHSFEEFRKLQMHAARELTRLQLDFMNLCMECNCEQMQRLATAETPSEIVAAESGLATEYMNGFSDNARQTLDALTAVQEKMYDWMQENSRLAGLGATPEPRTKTGKKSQPVSQ